MFNFNTYRSILKAALLKNTPYYVQYYITGRCNLFCRQCNIVETNSTVKELTFDEIRIVAKNLKQIGVGIVLLTGGEPFMRCDLPQIVEEFIKIGLNVRLQTAGTKFATKDKILQCYEAGARDINVSLDSLDYNTSDYINALDGSGVNAINTIEIISNIFRDRSGILSFGTVLSRFNYMEIPAILDFAKSIGWFVSLVPVHITSQNTPMGFRAYDKQFIFRESDFCKLDDLKVELLKKKNNGSPIFDSERYIHSAIDYLKGKGVGWRTNNVCDSPNLYFAVRPNGDFTTCCDYVLNNPPNLADNQFHVLYKNGLIRKRDDVKNIVLNCSGCHYGSYPEVTLSVRSLSAFIERALTTVKYRKGMLKKASVKKNFFESINNIKSKYTKVYPKEQWLDDDLKNTLNDWQNKNTKKDIIRSDITRRKIQKRRRGKDVLLPQYK